MGVGMMTEIGAATVQAWARKREYHALVRRLESRQRTTSKQLPPKPWLLDAIRGLWKGKGA